MKKFITVCSAIAVSFSLPTVLFAQANITGGFVTLGGLIRSFTDNIVTALVALLLGLATVAFFYGIVQYIWALRDGNGEKAKNGRSFMVWGLIALFVMVSVWGIIKYAQGVFGIPQDSSITVPGFRIGAGGGAPSGGSGLPSGATVGGGTGGLGGAVGGLIGGSGGGGVTGGGSNGGTLQASNAFCQTAAIGAVCDIGGGITGRCDVSTDGVPGCYRVTGGTGGGINYGANCTSSGSAGTCSDQMTCITDIGGTPGNSSAVTATCGAGSVCCIPPTSGGGGSTGSGYSCTPGYDCTLPNGAGIGLCDTSGQVCVSNTPSSNTGNATCAAYGDGAGCTDSNGLSGVCLSGVCTPNNTQ
jgi:hypothetical protein